MITVSVLQNSWDTIFYLQHSCNFSLLHIETVLNVDSKKLKTDDGNKGTETRKTPIVPKASFQDDDPWYDHDHDKCIADQLGLDFDAPIPAYCKPT
jgi:hypothetical protein